MTSEDYAVLQAQHDDRVKSLTKIDNFYDYEDEFARLTKGLRKEILERQLSDLPAGKRKKNPQTAWGNTY